MELGIAAVYVIALLTAIIAFVYAVYLAVWVKQQKNENKTIERIAGLIRAGADTFMRKEYTILAVFAGVLAVLIFLFLPQPVWKNEGGVTANLTMALSYIAGTIFSAIAGKIGIMVAALANARCAEAATEGIKPSFLIGFRGGAVMGLMVVGSCLLGVLGVLLLTGDSSMLLGFSFGASSLALFAKAGGGIFTKTADVSADLAGKVELGIPEDDPRNPAVIADNVGDNVGDVAGMGADLFESFVGSIVGAMILGLAAPAAAELKLKLMLLPLLIAVVGVLSSVAGTALVRAKPGSDPQKALNLGTMGAAGLATLLVFGLLHLVMGAQTLSSGAGLYHVFGATVIGLVAGVVIGQITEYYTGTDKRPVLSILKACETGSATTLISGLGVGMRSTFPTVLVITAGIFGSFLLAGLYGVGIAAVGMLMTLGIQLAVDAYGPIADNAGGLAEMAELPRSVRKITDSLDAVGNTTAAIGKGFAIGSAALTAIILLSSFRDQAGLASVEITDPRVMVGVLIGSVIPFLFSALAMSAVGTAAHQMIAEVRRQFRAHPGILTGEEKPDYRRCIDISTRSALREMLLPGLIAIASPVLVGFLGGISMLIGLLTGATITGVALAIFMSNSGGAWDNAKKMAEADENIGKGSDSYKAAVVGDTVGDPFKDTAGPALNILIKLMSMVSLVIAPMLKAFWG